MTENSEVLKSRSIELKSRSIETFPEVDRSKYKSIDRIFPEPAFAERARTPNQKPKSSPPSDFCSRTRWFRVLGCL